MRRMSAVERDMSSSFIQLTFVQSLVMLLSCAVPPENFTPRGAETRATWGPSLARCKALHICDPRTLSKETAQRRGILPHALEVAQPVSAPKADANEEEISEGVYEGARRRSSCCALPDRPITSALSAPCASYHRGLTGWWWAGVWHWTHSDNQYRIRYQRSGSEGPHAVLVHGFGGNWCETQVGASYCPATA